MEVSLLGSEGLAARYPLFYSLRLALELDRYFISTLLSLECVSHYLLYDVEFIMDGQLCYVTLPCNH